MVGAGAPCYRCVGSRVPAARRVGPGSATSRHRLVIDTHSHLLPGIDDGAASLDESLTLARQAARAGVREIVCTPHLRDRTDLAGERAPALVQEVQAALDAARVPIRLHLGYELSFSFAASLEPEELERYSLGAGTSAILVEMPYSGWPPFAEEAVFRWRLRGLVPVLARPERSERVQRDPAIVSALLRMGAVAQGTAPSVVGRFGAASRRCLMRLLARGELSLFASDAHARRRRDCDLAQAGRQLRRLAPDTDMRLLTTENPARLLRGDDLLPVVPIRVRRPWEAYLRRVL